MKRSKEIMELSKEIVKESLVEIIEEESRRENIPRVVNRWRDNFLYLSF